VCDAGEREVIDVCGDMERICSRRKVAENVEAEGEKVIWRE